MTFSLVLFAVNCTGSKTSESVSESIVASESVSESIVASEPSSEGASESESNSSVNNGEIPIVGAGENGEVNLGDALDLLAPVLSNNYITIGFTQESVATISSVRSVAQTTVTAFVKKTLNGYDVVAIFKQVADVQGDTRVLATANIYYVDGLAVYGFADYNSGINEMEWKKFEAGTFNELVNKLNVMIASDEEALEVYREVMKAVKKLEVILEGQDLANKNLNLNFNFAEYVNDLLDFIVANKEENMYDFLLENVWGINVDDAEAVASFENSIIELCNTNPTIASIIDEVVTAFNNTLMENARNEAIANGTTFDESAVFQLDLEKLLDLLQEQIGVTTAQVVDLIKQMVPELSDYLTVPEDGESLYDYLMVRAQMITVDDVAKVVTGDQNATLLTVIWGLKNRLTNITLGDVINGLVSNFVGDSVTSGEADYVAMLNELNVDLQTLLLGITFKADAYGRPTDLGTSNRVQVSYLDLEDSASSQIITATIENSIKITFSYEKIYIAFEIPQEVLDVAVPA